MLVWVHLICFKIKVILVNIIGYVLSYFNMFIGVNPYYGGQRIIGWISVHKKMEVVVFVLTMP